MLGGLAVIGGVLAFYAGVAWWFNRDLKGRSYLTPEQLEGIRRRLERSR